MRRIIFAPSFDAEFFELSCAIERRFGPNAADNVEFRIKTIAENVARMPMMGTRQHGYSAKLHAIVESPNWIFYRFTEGAVHFLHIRDGRRDKGRQRFEG